MTGAERVSPPASDEYVPRLAHFIFTSSLATSLWHFGLSRSQFCAHQASYSAATFGQDVAVEAMHIISSLQSSIRDLSPYFFYLLLVATQGPLLFGYHLAELNAPQDVITCARRSIRPDRASANLPQCIPMNPAEFGLVSSIFTLGGLVGALVAGPLSARYGRLITMRFTTGFFALGPVAEALAPNVATMAIGRFVSGLGAGASVVTVPIYLSEIAPPHQKGFFGAFTQISTNMGILITQVLGYFLSHGQMWRLILAAGGLIGVLQLAGLTFAIESPKWQADHRNPRKAKDDLRRIRGHQIDVDEEVDGWGIESSDDMEGERETLLDDQDHVSHQDDNDSKRKTVAKDTLGIFEVLYHPDYNKASIAVMMVMLAQQFCGINSIVMYGVSLLADLLKANSALLNVFVSLLNLIVTFSCAPLPDILGRKTCILASTFGMGSSSIMLAIGIREGLPALSVVAVLLFVASFGLGLGPVPFILSSELVGPEAVGATQSWALAANWIATFVVAQFFPIINERLGKGMVYFVFAGLAAFFFIFIAWFVPETKGKKSADEVWGREPRRDD